MGQICLKFVNSQMTLNAIFIHYLVDMIENLRAGIKKISVHYCGNKGNGEELKLSESEYNLKDDHLHDTLLQFFTGTFKSGEFFNFRKSPKSIFQLVEGLFNDIDNFHSVSVSVATKLFDQSVHPSIKSGEFYMVYFQDLVVDGEMCNAIGIYKTENKLSFLKVHEDHLKFQLELEKGFRVDKLDKGALIFQTEKESGYKISVVDNSSKSPEIANYWQFDFLDLVPRNDAFHKTKVFIDAAKGFCDEVLTEENNVPKAEKLMMLNRSVGFLNGRNNFSMSDFSSQVMPQEEVFREFTNYKKNFCERNNLNDIEDFEISQAAYNRNKKYLRGVIKLDKNFHIYVHGKHEFIEKGYDEEKGKKFYKLYFDSED